MIPNPSVPSLSQLAPGQRLARGVCRALAAQGFACLEEFVPRAGLRADVMALGPAGEFWIVECKSGLADLRADRKWQGYLAWCDRFFWAVDPGFPTAVLPAEGGLILADAHDAELARLGPERRLAAARRKALLQGFARQAARRLQGLRDPGVAALQPGPPATG